MRSCSTVGVAVGDGGDGGDGGGEGGEGGEDGEDGEDGGDGEDGEGGEEDGGPADDDLEGDANNDEEKECGRGRECPL